MSEYVSVRFTDTCVVKKYKYCTALHCTVEHSSLYVHSLDKIPICGTGKATRVRGAQRAEREGRRRGEEGEKRGKRRRKGGKD